MTSKKRLASALFALSLLWWFTDPAAAATPRLVGRDAALPGSGLVATQATVTTSGEISAPSLSLTQSGGTPSATMTAVDLTTLTAVEIKPAQANRAQNLVLYDRDAGGTIRQFLQFDSANGILFGTAEQEDTSLFRGGAHLLKTNDRLQVTSFTMATGAGAGKVLTSDGGGNATWQTGGGGGPRLQSVSDIRSPTEIAALTGTQTGELLLAYNSTNSATLYRWGPAATANSPYIVVATGGCWYATGGCYTYSGNGTYIDSLWAKSFLTVPTVAGLPSSGSLLGKYIGCIFYDSNTRHFWGLVGSDLGPTWKQLDN